MSSSAESSGFAWLFRAFHPHFGTLGPMIPSLLQHGNAFEIQMVTTLLSTITSEAKLTAKPLQMFTCVGLESLERHWPDNAQEAWTQAPVKDGLFRFVRGLDKESLLPFVFGCLMEPCTTKVGFDPYDLTCHLNTDKISVDDHAIYSSSTAQPAGTSISKDISAGSGEPPFQLPRHLTQWTGRFGDYIGTGKIPYTEFLSEEEVLKVELILSKVFVLLTCIELALCLSLFGFLRALGLPSLGCLVVATPLSVVLLFALEWKF